ncbi:MAG: leucyl aminopeptidase [Cyanobacteria bacterium P01_H01_bin.74]
MTKLSFLQNQDIIDAIHVSHTKQPDSQMNNEVLAFGVFSKSMPADEKTHTAQTTESTADLGPVSEWLSRHFPKNEAEAFTAFLSSSALKFSGKPKETLVLPAYGQAALPCIVLVGLGKEEKITSQVLRRAAAAVIKLCNSSAMPVKTESVRLQLLLNKSIPSPATQDSIPLDALFCAIAEGALLSNYKFNQRKTTVGPSGQPKKREVPTVSAVSVVLPEGMTEGEVEAISKKQAFAETLADATHAARDWVNDSANFITPTFLKTTAASIQGLSCKVLSLEEAKAMGMHCFELVARGSTTPAYLIHLTYTPKLASATPSEKTVALVGKGITFDSGGLSLKPPASMELMKIDMAGAATVLAVMQAIASLGELKTTVHGIIPACENMPNGNAAKPGDIVTSMSGQTVEVNNTDAEGRLILCDALTYAQQYTKASEIIDLATLTGASIVALGKVAAAAMGTSDAMIHALKASGEQAGEKLWQLPLDEDYAPLLKSDVADLKNAGAKGEAGTIAAGMFLKTFVTEGQAWTHLDIAGPAFTSTETPETPAGGTGFGVRTLLYYLYCAS